MLTCVQIIAGFLLKLPFQQWAVESTLAAVSICLVLVAVAAAVACLMLVAVALQRHLSRAMQAARSSPASLLLFL